MPEEHPLLGVVRLLDLAAQVKAAAPGVAVLGSGYSYLRQFIGPVAAAVLARGGADLIGLGREGFAYPDLPAVLLAGLAPDVDRMCIACSRCTQIMRDHGRSGCVPFDREVYGPIYREGRQAARRGAA